MGLRATSASGLQTRRVSTRRRTSERPGHRKIEQQSPICGPDWRRCGCCAVFSPGLGPLPTWTDWASVDVRAASPWRFRKAHTSAPSLVSHHPPPHSSLSSYRANIDQSRLAQAPPSLLDAHAASLFFLKKSAETRLHLMGTVLVEGRDVASAARSVGLSARSASRYLRYFRETGGEFHYAPEQGNRHRENIKDNAWLRAAVLTAVEEQPELFLDEMADAVNHLAAEVGPAVEVSPVSVSRIFSRSGITRKMIEKACFTRNEARRALRVEARWAIPLRCRVYVDEAYRVGRAAERRWAWAVRGARAECYVASQAGVRTSFFVAMAHDRVLNWMITRPPPWSDGS